MPTALPQQGDETLGAYRRYLKFLARTHLDPRFQRQIDASDIVQQTLLQAHLAHQQYRGSSEQEKLGWLRAILIRKVAAAARHLNAHRRDVTRECSIQQDIETTSMRLNDFLASNGPTPSEQIRVRERGVELANAIEDLPEQQRRVLLLKYWHEYSLREIAAELGTTTAAVAGLAHRATRTLRRKLEA